MLVGKWFVFSFFGWLGFKNDKKYKRNGKKDKGLGRNFCGSIAKERKYIDKERDRRFKLIPMYFEICLFVCFWDEKIMLVLRNMKGKYKGTQKNCPSKGVIDLTMHVKTPIQNNKTYLTPGRIGFRVPWSY